MEYREDINDTLAKSYEMMSTPTKIRIDQTRNRDRDRNDDHIIDAIHYMTVRIIDAIHYMTVRVDIPHTVKVDIPSFNASHNAHVLYKSNVIKDRECDHSEVEVKHLFTSSYKVCKKCNKEL